jgi:2-polyprenyl-6-methoxyphenol hydroxylase-like FAD-dependent oxidoreductase
MSANQTPILIVGAGPTGLVLALWLRKRGIAFRIIDKSSAPGATSRALAVQARTLEFYRQLGISEDLINAGIIAEKLTVRRLGKVAGRIQFGAAGKDMSPFAYLLFCSQDVHEGILCKILSDLGVEVERETELVSLEQSSECVTAVLKSPKGIETLQAEYLCGCDGAHSDVRHAIQMEFPGGKYSQIFFVADVQATGAMAEGGVQISVSPKDFCIVMPIKTKGSIRLTGIVPPECELKQKIIYDDVAESVKVNTGLKVTKVNWFSSYHVHHRVAKHFRRGRVFLSGDAGHIHSPAGGQGMNTGIGDAINLAWKLADVVGGRFSPALLDSYEPERIAFAQVLVKTTDTAFKLLAGRSAIGSAFRAYVLPGFFAALSRTTAFRKFAFRTVSQIRISYRKSQLSEGSLGKLHAGDRLPWVHSVQGDNYDALKSLDWQIHIYGAVKSALGLNLRRFDIPTYQFEWNKLAEQRGLSRDALYVVRPDGHIGFISVDQDTRRVENYFIRIGHVP